MGKEIRMEAVRAYNKATGEALRAFQNHKAKLLLGKRRDQVIEELNAAKEVFHRKCDQAVADFNEVLLRGSN